MAINIKNSFPHDESDSSEITLPLIALRDIALFPFMVVPLFVGRSKSVKALANAMQGNKSVFLATQKKAKEDDPGENDLCTIGTIGKVLQLLRLPDGTVKALIEGKERAIIKQFIPGEQFFQVRLAPAIEPEISDVRKEALCKSLVENFQAYAVHDKNVSKEFLNTASTISEPSKLADSISAHFAFKIEEKQLLIDTISVLERVPLLISLIKKQIELNEMNQRIRGRVQKQIQKSHKNFYLNEQMRAIKKEMGSGEDTSNELDELEKQIKNKKMSEEATEKVKKELKKLRMMPPMSAEATVVRNYIDWIIDLPWFKHSDILNDLNQAETILNEDHFGLEKPKERILEYLAVQSLIKKVRGPILCFVGPPGVGKTSLAKSVARATGRKYTRISLGGVRDEAEIRGHRRTYIGAMPGKIIQSLKKVGVNNPVFCLDEIDKMSMDFRGDPSSALLEVLDPEQNFSFNDHYLDLDYDLSDILFITTANTLPDIPVPLQDRMEIIRLSGYTDYEKYYIGRDFLISKQVKMNGLEGRNITFSKQAVFTIIRRYTREAGVRNLEREIASICRKVAREVVGDVKKKEPRKEYKILASSIQKYLGPPRFKQTQIEEEEEQIGMVTGLAWTQVGGELLCVETLIMPGKGKLTVTGKLGDVMKESSQAAVSYVRSRSKHLPLEENFYKKYDIHIHIPEGAIPKDGPSAGITMCTSIVSALTRKPVRHDIAMTGEITLRGRVLPIGGLKEKILAAHRGGIKKVIIPKENEKDLKDIPSLVCKQLNIVLVEHIDEVLSHAIIMEEGRTFFINSDIPIHSIDKDTLQHDASLN